MRNRFAARLGVLMALALALAVVSAAPVEARKVKVWPTHTCAEEFGTDYVWDTTDAASFELTLTPQVSTACIDLTTGGGDFTVSFVSDGARVETYYASVRDSIPGNHCVDDPGWNTTGDDLTLSDVPASATEACGVAEAYPDTDPQLALWVGADFRGRRVGTLDVTITYEG